VKLNVQWDYYSSFLMRKHISLCAVVASSFHSFFVLVVSLFISAGIPHRRAGTAV